MIVMDSLLLRCVAITAVYGWIIQHVASNYAPWMDHFDHGTYIDGNSQYKLYWTVLSDENKIEIGLEVESMGWVAFGISPQGKMTNADIIIGWIDNDNMPILQNRFTSDYRVKPQLMENNNENIELLSGWKNNSKTYLHFTRLIFPCNENSVQIPIGTARVIYAWNNNNIPQYMPEIGDWSIEQHNNQHRGSESVNLLQGETSDNDIDMTNVSYIDLTMEHYHVPYDTHTTYYCKLFALPKFNKTQHIIRIDPIITSGHEGIVHHFSFASCPAEYVKEEDIGKEEICDDFANMGGNVSNCAGEPLLFAWAVGGANYYFPKHIGLEMGGNSSSSFQYVYLDIHYDNRLYRNDINDSSGIRIWYTSELRNYSAALLFTGSKSTPKDIFIPPNIETVKLSTYCTSLCTKDIPDDGMYAFANMLHTHETGISLKLRHIRDGIELPYIDQNDNYDFDYQQLWNLKEEIHILPGDELIVECEYSTVKANKSEMVFGGLSTQHEMCLSFVYLYGDDPDKLLTFCASEYLLEDVNDFWVYAQDNGWAEGNISHEHEDNDYENVFYDVTEEEALKYYMDFIQDNPPQKRLQKCLQKSEGQVVQIPADFVEYEEPDYGDCATLKSSDDGLEWYIWTIIGVGCFIVVVAMIIIICKLKRKRGNHYSSID